MKKYETTALFRRSHVSGTQTRQSPARYETPRSRSGHADAEQVHEASGAWLWDANEAANPAADAADANAGRPDAKRTDGTGSGPGSATDDAWRSDDGQRTDARSGSDDSCWSAQTDDARSGWDDGSSHETWDAARPVPCTSGHVTGTLS